MLVLMLVESNDWFTFLRGDKFGEKALGYLVVGFSYGTYRSLNCLLSAGGKWHVAWINYTLLITIYIAYGGSAPRHTFFSNTTIKSSEVSGNCSRLNAKSDALTVILFRKRHDQHALPIRLLSSA